MPLVPKSPSFKLVLGGNLQQPLHTHWYTAAKTSPPPKEANSLPASGYHHCWHLAYYYTLVITLILT